VIGATAPETRSANVSHAGRASERACSTSSGGSRRCADRQLAQIHDEDDPEEVTLEWVLRRVRARARKLRCRLEPEGCSERKRKAG
jgi:hypothetical protein